MKDIIMLYFHLNFIDMIWRKAMEDHEKKPKIVR